MNEDYPFKVEQYYERNFDRQASKILPGQYYVAGIDGLLVTTLGSCVSACLYDPTLRLGGMNHFMLPSSDVARDPADSQPARLGIHAMELLINALIRRGARRQSMRAKLFGGGAVLGGMTSSNVGERNVNFARAFLRTEGIPVVAEDLLDIYPRKVYFFTDTSRVLVRKLRHLDNDAIRSRERAYEDALRRTIAGAEAEIFS